MLNKEQILRAEDLKTTTVNVPEWGGKVKIKTLTGAERDDFEQSILRGGKIDAHNIRAKLCARCIVNEKNERLFSDAEIVALGNKSAIALDRVFVAAQKLNGLTNDEVEELAKNSEIAPNVDFVSN